MVSAFFAAIVPLATIAIVQFYNQMKAKDYEGAVTIIVAATVGVIVGLTHTYGLDVQTGLTLALAAVGIHTTAKQIG
jgi:hypothetical protein